MRGSNASVYAIQAKHCTEIGRGDATSNSYNAEWQEPDTISRTVKTQKNVKYIIYLIAENFTQAIFFQKLFLICIVHIHLFCLVKV